MCANDLNRYFMKKMYGCNEKTALVMTETQLNSQCATGHHRPI